LTTLNEPVFVECARALARTILQNGGSNETARVQYGFRRATSRWPTAREQTELLDLLRRQQDYLGEGWANVRELATGTNSAPTDLPPGSTPTQLAAYTVLSRVLLNLDETITKE
jgi:hypothetical protein